MQEVAAAFSALVVLICVVFIIPHMLDKWEESQRPMREQEIKIAREQEQRQRKQEQIQRNAIVGFRMKKCDHEIVAGADAFEDIRLVSEMYESPEITCPICGVSTGFKQFIRCRYNTED